MLEYIKEMELEIREATTRYINITCKDQNNVDFDFEGYTVQTYLSFGINREYVPTVIAGNIVSYKIPAEISLKARNGVAETRIFKNGDVYEVLRINVSVRKAEKPDLAPAD